VTRVHIAGKGPRRRLTRNRPDKLKALTRAIDVEPGAALDTASAYAPCRLRTGVGRTVSTGQNRSAAVGPNAAFPADDRPIAYNPPIGPPIGPCERPVIAAVNGIAAGANIARRGIGCAPGAP
jgi:enoyl-CoA hydratase/carnithine racemase